MIYRKATLEDLDRIWDKDIQRHNNSPTWSGWKIGAIEANVKKQSQTFVAVTDDGEPVGQITVIMSKERPAVKDKPLLCDGKTSANMNCFRIDKEYEGQGHISKLVKMGEEYAKEKGFKIITIGSEAKESRNLAIYLHMGYNQFLMSEMDREEPELDEVLILYYGKTL